MNNQPVLPMEPAVVIPIKMNEASQTESGLFANSFVVVSTDDVLISFGKTDPSKGFLLPARTPMHFVAPDPSSRVVAYGLPGSGSQGRLYILRTAE